MLKRYAKVQKKFTDCTVVDYGTVNCDSDDNNSDGNDSFDVKNKNKFA